MKKIFLIKTGNCEPIPRYYTYMTYAQYKQVPDNRSWPYIYAPFLLFIFTPLIKLWNRQVISRWEA